MRIATIALVLALGAAATVFSADKATKDKADSDKPQQNDAQAKITHGPILGRLSSGGVGVWARTSRPAALLVRYGESADKLDKQSKPAPTKLESDNTGWIQLDGLQPNTVYHYRIELAGKDDAKKAKPAKSKSRGGSFRTLPTSTQFRDKELNPDGLFNFRFEFACGNNQDVDHGSGPTTPAFKTMLEQLHGKINFAILNGDWLYEDARDTTPAQWRKQVGVSEADEPEVVKIAPTIVGVWENYKLYLDRSKNLNAWHRNVPSFFTFDDHEMLNDVWGAGSPGLRDRRAVFRDIGEAAWYDYLGWSNPTEFKQPIHFGVATLEKGADTLTDESADFTRLDMQQTSNLHVHWGGDTAGVNENDLDGVGGEPTAGVYEIVKVLDKHHLKISPAPKEDARVSYSIGRRSYYKLRMSNCEFFLLDTRSHREMHDTNEPDKPGLSILGQQQKKWLLDGVKNSDADFLFVVSSVNFMVPHVGGGKVRATNKDDAWTVFLDEREQLIEAFDKLGKPVLVLTGDLHNSFAIKITDRVWEFASGPHNSNNHFASDEGDRPATGPFQYGPRKCDIRWSTYFRSDIPRDQLQHPTYCVVQVNNVFNNPLSVGGERWVAFERPQVVVQYYDGRTGELRYAESILAAGSGK
ncbi:MAG: metallophosphoesterase family protein [Pirellulaceae bacterium]